MIKGIFLPHSGPPGLLVFPMLILSPLSFGAIFSLGTMRLLGGLLSGPSLELSLRMSGRSHLSRFPHGFLIEWLGLAAQVSLICARAFSCTHQHGNCWEFHDTFTKPGRRER